MNPISHAAAGVLSCVGIGVCSPGSVDGSFVGFVVVGSGHGSGNASLGGSSRVGVSHKLGCSVSTGISVGSTTVPGTGDVFSVSAVSVFDQVPEGCSFVASVRDCIPTPHASSPKTRRKRSAMRAKCCAGLRWVVGNDSVPAVAREPKKEAAASAFKVLGVCKHHTPPSAPRANVDAPNVQTSRKATPEDAVVESLDPEPFPVPSGLGFGLGFASGYHAKTDAFRMSITAMAEGDTDNKHGPIWCSSPNSHFFGRRGVRGSRGCVAVCADSFVSVSHGAPNAARPKGCRDGAGGNNGRTVATTSVSKTSPCVDARHTQSRRPGREANIHQVFLSSTPSFFGTVSSENCDSRKPAPSLLSGAAALANACAVAPKRPSRGVCPTGVFVNPSVLRCSRNMCAVVLINAVWPCLSMNSTWQIGCSNLIVRAPALFPSRRTTETHPVSSPAQNAFPAGDQTTDVTVCPLCPDGTPASYRPEAVGELEFESRGSGPYEVVAAETPAPIP
mmetsp:Transcript_4981/g.16624  ORF Transcript_4981/g.16624 Transcript_4981/m.16624 type:complete len:503 (-) Transcript_4981:570-2078(-)